MVWVLAVLRFVAVTLLAFLLISPMIRTIERTTEKPSIVIGIDNSSSISMTGDSAYYKTEFLQKIGSLRKKLEKNFEVKTISFGDKIEVEVQPLFKNELTDIASLFKQVNTQYYNRNIGAVILASDGIYNSGSDPLHEVRNSKYPVYTIMMGDTSSRRDLLIQKVTHNKIAYKGNRFPIEITIQGLELQGERSVLRITQAGNSLFSQEINLSSANQVITIPALLDASEIGLMRLKISLDEVDDEINTSNNSREIFIEVRESKMKVAIITDAPHPDIAALERAFSNSNNFEVQLFSAHEFNAKPESYNLIVLNQLPSLSNPFTQKINNILASKSPLLLIVGSQSNIQLFHTMKTGLSFLNYKGSFNEALPLLNSSFSLFLYNESQKKLLETFPPLLSPFATYQVANSVNIFCRQLIGSTNTEMPLIMFNETMDRRVGIIVGEGIWKWRMYDFIQNNSHSNFDDLLGKIFQYLTAQVDKSKFRIDWNNFYAENEKIEFGAMLFNDSYEPITNPEVSLQIRDEQKRIFDYTFTPGEERYSLTIGNFPPGIYTFEAKAKVSGEELVKRGTFVITDVKLEDINLVANHRLLNTMAVESGGKSYPSRNFDDIADQINTNETVKPVIYSTKNYMELVDYYPLMILLFILLGAEWFLRKYWGSY